MRYVKCNLCGSDDYALLDSHRNDRACKPEVEVRTVICKTCGLVYINPQLDSTELHNLYSGTYDGPRLNLCDEELIGEKEVGSELSLRWLDERVGVCDKPGKVLDIGCGTGGLLHAFQKRGWDAYGIEPIPHFAEFAKERYGIKVITGFLEDVSLLSSCFDMVTLRHTLEHFADPTQALAIIRNLLKDGGLIYINIPNILKPKHFRCFEAPHLYTYSPNTLSLLLRKTGFEPLIIESGWNILALAKKGNVDNNIDFFSEGDDYRKIIGSLKWRYIRLILRKCEIRLSAIVSLTIRHIFGERKGRKILELIKRFLLRHGG